MFAFEREAPSIAHVNCNHSEDSMVRVLTLAQLQPSASHSDTVGGTPVSSDVLRTNTESTVRATLNTGGWTRELQLLPSDHGFFLLLNFLSPHALVIFRLNLEI